MEEIIQESYDTSLYGVMAGKWVVIRTSHPSEKSKVSLPTTNYTVFENP